MGDDLLPTLGEVARSMGRLEKEISNVRQDIRSLEEKVPTKELIVTTERAWEANLRALEDRFVERTAVLEDKISDLEDWKTWTLRIVMGAVIMALMGLILTSSGG